MPAPISPCVGESSLACAVRRSRWRRWAQLLLGGVFLAVLLAVFALYGQPQFMLTLAEQVWACF